MTHDYVRCLKDPSSKKVVLVVPGANSDIEMNHIRAVVRQASKRGYHAIVVNPVVPPQDSVKALEIIDYRQDHALSRSVAVTKELFGEDAQIYAVGFSLGSNYLLKHLACHSDCQRKCGIKAAVSVSGAFDLPSTCVDIRNATLGLYDYYVLKKFKKVFGSHRFKVQDEKPTIFSDGVLKATNLYEFESMTRVRALGMKSAAKLLREISCNQRVLQIKAPLLILAAKDDVVTKVDRIPIDDLKKSPHALMAIYEKGGHCDFFFAKKSKRSGKTYHKEFIP